jgi:hypothetical protein
MQPGSGIHLPGVQDTVPCPQFLAQFSEIICIIVLLIHDGYRKRPAGVPVAIEPVGKLRHDSPGRNDAEVPEVQCGPEAEVLIGNVPATDNRHLGIRHNQFVVHAVIGAPEIVQVIDITNQHVLRTQLIGIEDPHLDIWMDIQREHHRVLTGEKAVIDQQPDPDAPVSRQQQPLEEQRPHRILQPEEVLEVE